MSASGHQVRKVMHGLREEELCLWSLHWRYRWILMLWRWYRVVIVTWARSMTWGIGFRIRIMICFWTSRIVVMIFCR